MARSTEPGRRKSDSRRSWSWGANGLLEAEWQGVPRKGAPIRVSWSKEGITMEWSRVEKGGREAAFGRELGRRKKPSPSRNRSPWTQQNQMTGRGKDRWEEENFNLPPT